MSLIFEKEEDNMKKKLLIVCVQTKQIQIIIEKMLGETNVGSERYLNWLG